MQLFIAPNRVPILRVMKLLFLFTVLSCLQAAAKGYGQTITLHIQNAPLETVFKEVKKQTGYAFLYTRDQLTNTVPVSLNVQSLPLKDALNIAFKNQPVSFTMDATYIVVQTRKQATIAMNNPDTLIDIRGHISDEDGEPLAGVTVHAKQSNRAVASNSQGDFTLTDIRENDLLSISSIGFYSEEVRVKAQRYFSLRLRAAVNSLEETVVKGYYTSSKKLNTGSVVKVTGKEITNQPISNPILGLEGMVPGLLITQNNGLPGSRFKALIRGQNSIQNGNSPLYVIDGVPFLSDNDALTQLNGMLANSPFNSIDPNDIESIEILKDADATAIYGSRGANGVILITTKKNKSGKDALSLTISNGWGKVARTMPLMNTQQYLEMRREAFKNDGIVPTLSNAPDLLGWDQSRYTDWKKLFIGGTAKTFNAQVRYSGGNDFTKFSVGSGYRKETCVYPGEFNDKKTTADIKLFHKTKTNKLIFDVRGSYAEDRNALPTQDLTAYILHPPNGYPLKDAQGNFVWREAGYSFGNRLALLQQSSVVTTTRITTNASLSYKPFRLVEFKVNGGYNKLSADERLLSPIISQDPAFSPKGTSAFGDNFISTWIIEPQALYHTPITKRIKLEALLGGSFQKNLSAKKLITAKGYTSDALLSSLAAASSIAATQSKFQYNYAAIFARLGIDLDGRYLLNMTGRRDGSSRFGPDNRFANFAAIGAGWIFSKETLIKNALPFLSFGKLRGSYGVTGNDQIGNYQYLDTYRATVYTYDGQAGLVPSRLLNSDYSWERNKKTELAFELGFFKDRLTLNLNCYKNKSDNQIIRYNLPGQTGFNDILLNFPGSVLNKGIEFSLAADIVQHKNFTWTSSFNISANKNILQAFPGLASSSYAASFIIGKPLNANLGLHYLGVDPQTGIYQFEDKNKDGQIDNADYGYTGTTDPKYYGGFSNAFRYKNFQLNFLFEFRNQNGRDAVFANGIPLGELFNQPTAVLQRWQRPGDRSSYQRYTSDVTSAAYKATFNMYSSDAILTNASYIRLKNIAFSYNLPQCWLKKMKAQSWSLFLQMQNILTISKYNGHDPESQALTSLPPLRMITAGAQVNF
ncbi:MAG: hypothetical protein JWQ27_260 [Ferruginibacter sp.]|nr:hypothetical protein [Ferruginibacter sp.]